MTRIAVWTASHLPELGGFQWSTYRLAKALMDAGIEVTFVTRVTEAQGSEGSVPVLRFSGSDVHEWTIESGQWLLKNKDRFDVIHVIDYFYKAVDEQLGILGQLALPAILKTPTPGCVPRLINTPERRAAIARINGFAAINYEIVQELEQVGINRGRIHFLPNGIDCNEFCPGNHKEATRQQLGLPDSIIVLYMGRLVQRKRTDVLLEAMQQMPEDINLIMVGSSFGQHDSVEEEILSIARMMPNVIVRPATDNQLPYFQGADIHTLLSERDGMPNSVLEGMACGVATVASAIHGHIEVIDSGVDGILVPVGDAEASAEAILTLARHPEFRQKLGSSARTKIVSGFEVNDIARQYANIYEAMIAEGGLQ